MNTPLFGGGATPDASAELRPPSIKGVLRFWWRALAWSRHVGDLDKIRSDEARIVGDNVVVAGAGPFLLPVAASLSQVGSRVREVVGVGARYFGYGLMEAFDSTKTGAKAGQLTRPCLKAPFEFTVELVSREKIDPSVVEALRVMGLLGGLGSRTRRGWGNLTLRSLRENDAEAWQSPNDHTAYAKALCDILSSESLQDGEPPYSAFCKQTRIEIVAEGSDPLQLLNTVGEQMLRYRSWGKNGQVLGQKSEQNFQLDHEWSKNPGGGDVIRHPRRVIFGLPHNYSKTLGVQTQHYDRRASPLLIHIHRLGDDGHYIAVLTVLRSAFLPPEERMKVTNGHRETLRDSTPDWNVLDDFIDGTSNATKKAYFPNRTKVLP